MEGVQVDFKGCDQWGEVGTTGGNTPKTKVGIGGKPPFWALGFYGRPSVPEKGKKVRKDIKC